MKRLLLLPLMAVIALAAIAQRQDRTNAKSSNNAQYQVFGVAFYNLENLFDTIPNNPLGRDAE